MGNNYSKWHDICDSEHTVPIHLTLFLPVFGLPNQVESFILSSSIPYPDDPLLGAFVISPWFEQIPNKLSNEEFLKKYQCTARYADNYVPQKNFTWNSISKVYEPKNPATESDDVVELEPNLLELPVFLPWTPDPKQKPGEPEGLHYRPKRFDLDTSQYHIIISSKKSGKEYPSHVPFFKIGLPQPQNLLQNNSFFRVDHDVAQVWNDRVYPYEHLHNIDLDGAAVLPFKGLGVRQEFSKHDYSFDKSAKPYTGLGGDGIKTEYEIFSEYKYPHKSLISIRATDGYSLDTMAYLPHIDTIPAHHLGTILILDMINEDAVTVLSRFITTTLEFLQRGCILPLTNVNLWVLQLNAEKLDHSVLKNDLIFEKLTEIGFDLSHIHLCPYEISPYYALPPIIPIPQTRNNATDRPPLCAYPLLSKPNLTHFLTPIWNTVYLKTFKLHQDGHWNRLINKSIKKNPGIKFIPPNIFPTNELLHHYRPIPQELFKKQFIPAMKGYDPYYHHTDDETIASTLSFAAMYRNFQIKAKEYFGPLLENKSCPSLLNNSNGELQSAYELLFNDKEPLWDNPRSYFPHIKNINQLIQNPKPLHFISEYNPASLNNERPLPKQYKAPFVKKFARPLGVETTESDHGNDGDDDDDEIDVLSNGRNDNKRNKKIYPKFYTSQSIWPAIHVSPNVNNHNNIDTINKNNQIVSNTKKDDIKNNNNENFPPMSLSTPQMVQQQSSTLSDQIISLGLPRRYEFESFILWSDQVVIADQSNMFEYGYFYEPHVQDEIIQAVDQIKLEKSQQQSNDPLTTTCQDTSPLHPASRSCTQPKKILEALLPISVLPQLSKSDQPTPFQYLSLVAPTKISHYYPSPRNDFDRDNTEFSITIWVTLNRLQKRLNEQIYSRIVSRLLGHLHLLPKEKFSFLPNRHLITPIIDKHMVPPVLRQQHYTTSAALSYAHTRVEFIFTGEAFKINGNLVSKSDGGGGNGQKNEDRPVIDPTNDLRKIDGDVDTVDTIDGIIAVDSFIELIMVDSTPEKTIKTLTKPPTQTSTPALSETFESPNKSGEPIEPIHSTKLPLTTTTPPVNSIHPSGDCFTSTLDQTRLMTQKSKALTQTSLPPSNTLISTPEIKPSNIEIGLTYLHRCTASTTVTNQDNPPTTNHTHCLYATHPLVSNVSFLPLAWLHGIFILPFVYIASRTKLIKHKFGFSESPIFLNRPIGECPYPSSQPQADPLPSFSAPNNTFRSYPPGFIPPPIPPFPSPASPWSHYGPNHGIHQNNHAKRIVDAYQKHLSSKNLGKPEHSLPFTIPLLLEDNSLHGLLPKANDYIMLDPCHGSQENYLDSPSLANYHSPMTFIILISNPIYPDPVPYSNIEIPCQVMGSKGLTPIPRQNGQDIPMTQDELNKMLYLDLLDPREDWVKFTPDELDGNKLDNIYDDGCEDEIHRAKIITTTTAAATTTTISSHQTPIEDLPSIMEPITQSQFRYYQEYIPVLYKRQLTEYIYGHGLKGSTTSKLEKLWTVEVHTPDTLKAAIKRIENSAVETRLTLYRDLALALQHDQE